MSDIRKSDGTPETITVTVGEIMRGDILHLDTGDFRVVRMGHHPFMTDLSFDDGTARCLPTRRSVRVTRARIL